MGKPLTVKQATLDLLRATFSEQQARARLSAQPDRPRPPALRGARRVDRASIAALWDKLRGASPVTEADERLLADPDTVEAAGTYAANIENMIGTVKVPIADGVRSSVESMPPSVWGERSRRSVIKTGILSCEAPTLLSSVSKLS